MTREAISLCALNKTLNRVENKLQTLEGQFAVLDSNIQKLTEKFEFQTTVMELQFDEDEMWSSLLEDRFSSVEVNLFYSYICETVRCLHSEVVKILPDLAKALPTLSSVLRRKGRNQRIRLAWESTLEKLELQERDVKALCAFFIANCHNACYYPADQRQNYASDISSIINNMVKNQMLQQSLLSAIRIVEHRKTEHTGTCKEQETHPKDNNPEQLSQKIA